jgi:hypothetical protein
MILAQRGVSMHDGSKAKVLALGIFNKLKTKDFIFILPFVYLSLKIRLQYFYYLKSPGQSFPSSDDSKWYLAYAHSLLEGKGMSLHMNDIMYFGYNILLTLLIGIFKDTPTILFLQAVTAGLSVILVFKIARKLFNLMTAIIACYFYCYYAWSITLWASFILSDSFYITLLLLTVYLLLKAMETKKRIHAVLFIAASLYLLIFRPTGVFNAAFIFIYIIINTRYTLISAMIKKHRFKFGGALFTLAAAGIYLLASGRLDPFIESIQYNAKLVLYNVYAYGKVYDVVSVADYPFKADYRTNIMNSLIVSFIVNNWSDISILYGRRIVAFIGNWVWSTDLTTREGIVHFAENMIPTLLVVISTAAVFMNGIFRKASIIWLMIATIFIFCIVLFIDGMYRYKAPSIPFIAIAAAYGMDRVLYACFQLVRAAAKLARNFGKKRTEPRSAGLTEQKERVYL